MQGTGFIKLPRSIQGEYWYQTEPFDKARAYIDLIMMASHKPYSMQVNGVRTILDRGQLTAAQPFLARRWSWSVGKVRRFLSKLEEDNLAIVQKPQTTPQTVPPYQTIITICKYDNYNTLNVTKNHPSGTPLTPDIAPQTVPQTTPQTVTDIAPQTIPDIAPQTIPNTRSKEIEKERRVFSPSFLDSLLSTFEEMKPSYVTSLKDNKKKEQLAAAIFERLTKVNPTKEIEDQSILAAWKHYVRHMDDYYTDKPLHYVIDHIDEIANKIASKSQR